MALSRWPPYSPLPRIAPDGTVSEPLSGRYNITCRPEEGGEGIQRAIRVCPEGGSILCLEGIYHVTRPLLIDRSVHLFGLGRAKLVGFVPPWGGDSMLETAAPAATLSGLLISNQAWEGSHTLLAVAGRLRLQGCHVTARPENAIDALVASCDAFLDVAGCKLRGGGGNGVTLGGGIAGARVVHCEIQGFVRESGIRMLGSSSGPGSGDGAEAEAGAPAADSPARVHVAGNTIRDCLKGVHLDADVGPSWRLGEGNAFANCAEGDVVDERTLI